MTHVAIAGVGYTPFTRKSGRSVLDLAAEACRNAAADAGFPLHAIDGVGSFSVFNDSVPCSAVATALALPGLRYTLDLNAAGQSPCHAVAMAALAISAGHADAIVVFRALNGRSGMRIGHGAIPGGAGAYRYPIGYSSYLMYIAMWARRYMIETGATADDFGAVAVAQRWYAERNSRAVVRPGGRRVRRGRIEVVVGEPLRPAGTGWPATLALRDAVRRVIVDLSGEPDLG